jgi:ABC-type cobalamin/Fe3+-siderophores transport system ATPase subunit
MIEISNLKYSFNNVNFLNDINVTVDDGEILGIIGTSGSGKSILLKILSGQIKGYEGEIIINKIPLGEYSKQDIHIKISSLVNNIPDNLEDTIYNFSLLSRTPYKSIFKPFNEYDLQVTDEYIESFQLSGIKNHKLGQLSDCLLQKVLLVHAFIREAPFLVLDNPTSSLDLSSSSILRRCLLKYVINGERTALIASSDLNFIFQTADKIIIMDNGTIAEKGYPDIISTEMIKKYFKVDVLMSRNIYNGRPEIHIFHEG